MTKPALDKLGTPKKLFRGLRVLMIGMDKVIECPWRHLNYSGVYIRMFVVYDISGEEMDTPV